MSILEIENNETYKSVISDSFGGVMYNEANRNKYDAADIIKIWDNLDDGDQQTAGGIMKGAINFLKGE